MKAILSIFSALLLSACATLASAANVTLTWSAPTQNTDNSSPALVSGYNLYAASSDAALSALFTSGGKPIVDGSVLNSASVLTYTFTNVAAGSYFYAVTAWYCSPAGTCVESAPSGHVSTTIVVQSVPGAPGNVKVSASIP